MKKSIYYSRKQEIIEEGKKIVESMNKKFLELSTNFLSEETKIESYEDFKSRLREIEKIENLYKKIGFLRNKYVESTYKLCRIKFSEISINYCKKSEIPSIRKLYRHISSL